VFVFTCPVGGNDDDDYAYEESVGPQDPNPIKIGHTFEMLPHPRIDKFGMSPLPLSHMDIANLHDERQSWGLVSPPHSAVVYRLHDIHTVFLALLLIQVGLYTSFAQLFVNNELMIYRLFARD